MPNGGSDCCATCWFNAKNEGEAGYSRTHYRDRGYCSIRNLQITTNPFYTYCGNHPHHRPVRDPIPIGPVFTGDASGRRAVWRLSPDTEEIRDHLLSLLAEIDQHPAGEYPAGFHTWELVVWQVGEFKETRALEQLRRIATLCSVVAPEEEAFDLKPEDLPRLTQEALEKIVRQPD